MKDIFIKGEKGERATVRFKIVSGKIRYTDSLIYEEILSFIGNLERGASMEICQDEEGTWSPLDYLLRTLRPNIDVRKLKPEGLDVITLLWGAGLDIDKRMNVFHFVTDELKKHALIRVKNVNKEHFNILHYMRDVFEKDIEKIVAVKVQNENNKNKQA